jgi:hypothetical protein
LALAVAADEALPRLTAAVAELVGPTEGVGAGALAAGLGAGLGAPLPPPGPVELFEIEVKVTPWD